MRILKINYNANGGVDVDYELFSDVSKSYYKHPIKGLREKPLRAFDDAMRALDEVLCSICELPATDADRITIHGLAQSFDKDQNLFVSIIGAKDLRAGGTLALATPAKPIESLTDKQAMLIDEVINAAADYVQGKRQQMALAFDNAEEVAV